MGTRRDGDGNCRCARRLKATLSCGSHTSVVGVRRRGDCNKERGGK
jgi:hypothetical protein